MNIHVDIQRRIVRSRPASLTDLYMLNKTYNMNIMLPKIPDTFYEYDEPFVKQPIDFQFRFNW